MWGQDWFRQISHHFCIVLKWRLVIVKYANHNLLIKTILLELNINIITELAGIVTFWPAASTYRNPWNAQGVIKNFTDWAHNKQKKKKKCRHHPLLLVLLLWLGCSLDFLHSVKMTSLQLEFHFWEEEEVAMCQIWQVGQVWSNSSVGAAQKTLLNAHCHEYLIDKVPHIIWVLSQLSHNVAVELCVDSLTIGVTRLPQFWTLRASPLWKSENTVSGL